MKENKITFDVGGIFQQKQWSIVYDEEIEIEEAEGEERYIFNSHQICPHCKETHRSSFDVGHSYIVYVCPRCVKAINEGGHAATLVCLDCILDAVKELDRREKQKIGL